MTHLNRTIQSICVLAVLWVSAFAEWKTGVAIGLHPVWQAPAIPLAIDLFFLLTIRTQEFRWVALGILWVTITSGYILADGLDEALRIIVMATVLVVVVLCADLAGERFKRRSAESELEAQQAREAAERAERVARQMQESQALQAAEEARRRAERDAIEERERQRQHELELARVKKPELPAGPVTLTAVPDAPAKRPAPSREEAVAILAETDERSPTALSREHGGSEGYWRKLMRETEMAEAVG